MKILFIITARGGSKGIPKKNIQLLNNIPLIGYKIISSLKCKYEGRVFLSTDDEEIAEIGINYGAECPFLRPRELATDEASSIDVVMHAMEWIEKNDIVKYDYVFLLEPSSPFATYVDFNNALDIIIESNADTLLGVKKAEVNTRFIKKLDKKGKLSNFYYEIKNMNSVRRQDQEIEYTLNGCMYISKWEYFKKNRSFHSINSVPYIMDFKNSIELDSIDDLDYARYLVSENKIDLSYWKI